ncbi:MAG: VTT domain-containing protein [Anaerolineae bacterium]|nr:VTT domain-containing protein [Anaerolineae bacterium]
MDLIELIKTVGYIGLFGIIFAESGLFVGFFLPGDSLLFTAGFLSSVPTETGGTVLSLPLVIVGCAIAAIVGDNVGYAFGRRVGRRFFQKDDSLLFKKKYVLKAQAFYDKHGGKTIVLARFMPIVRTFAPIVAGIGEMEYRRFFSFNIVGGLLWAVGLPLAGYFLGNLIPDVDKYLLPIVVLIVLLSVAPTALHVLRDAEMREGLLNAAKGIFGRTRTAGTKPKSGG